jgi:rod shape-determining protein MreD
MTKRIIFFIVILYILTLLQASFLVHFSLSGFLPNFVLIAVILVHLFSSSSKDKIIAALIGGFYLDVFSLNNAGGFFGFYILIMLAIFLFLKIISEKYVRFPIVKKI